jgi:hypothetical protein
MASWQVNTDTALFSASYRRPPLKVTAVSTNLA